MALTSVSSQKNRLLESVIWIVIAAICGGLAGAAAGFVTGSIRIVEAPVAVPLSRATSTPPLPSTPTSTFALVPVAQRPAAALVPSAFLTRRSSSVASVYKKPKGTTIEDRALGNDRLLGQAVALTADGWFVTNAAAIQGLHVADLTVWHDGSSFTVSRATIDHLNGTVFLKTNATGLPAAAFVHSGELAIGQESWIESRAGQLAPAVTVDLRDRLTPNDSVSSEVATRRIRLNGTSAAGDVGGAVWDPSGSLIGLIESAVGEQVRLVPAATIGASFASLLSTGQIQHAVLGVRAIDLADLRIDGSRGDLPMTGAWIHDDKKAGKAGILHDGPGAKAQLQIGDVILRIEHDILDGTADLGEILADYRPGAKVTLRVLQGTTDRDVSIVLGSHVTGENLK